MSKSKSVFNKLIGAGLGITAIVGGLAAAMFLSDKNNRNKVKKATGNIKTKDTVAK